MIEEELLDELKTIFIATALTSIKEKGDMKDFIDYGRKKAKEDGMNSDELMEFFDFLENLEDDGINWEKTLDIIGKVTGCKCGGFKGDSCVIIENQEMDMDDINDYCDGETQGKINLEHINKALRIIDVRLEFIEAMNIPFDADGFQNFCRFKVIKIE